MVKRELRNQQLNNMKALSPDRKVEIERGLQHYLHKTQYWQNASVIGITISQSFEWDTITIIEQAWSQQKRVCIPRTNPINRELTFYLVESFEQLETAHYGLKEPVVSESKKITKSGIDLLIVPGMVFDQQGYRIGFGGGYYDRFLIDFYGATLSLAWTEQLVESVPHEGHDIPVQHIVTEKGVLI
ncbi:5-formyltetrahydrofolate cyclo-ligase [Radiobacillus sp. PE A8.2]|uniref:5-formyltetrahydrofolate cyclo-ligase n=1 Tax=Radiobacillus sp. PE A8.2 TaxID=3380349 RepID=UPI00388F803E